MGAERCNFWRTLVGAAALVTLAGCATTPNPYIPAKADWKDSTRSSLTDPATWVPLLGAVAVVATNSDNHLSEWGSSHNPVFGSRANAEDFSKNGKDALEVLAFGSVLLSPQSHPDVPWLQEKAEDLVVAYAAHGWADGAAGALKEWTGRERPNGQNNHSFPSGHATSSGAYAAITLLNIDQFEPDPMYRLLMKAGVYTVAAGVAWGRVESQAHYPTDVLVGLGLGNFIAETVYGAFLHAGMSNVHVAATPERGGLLLTMFGTF